MDMKVKRAGYGLMDFFKDWKYLIGIVSVALVASIFILMFLFNLTDYGISFAAIAATLFMIFNSKPDSEQVSFEKIYPAYLIAGVCGLIGIYIGNMFGGAVSLILCVILMVALKKQHTPAVGFALSFVVNGFDGVLIMLTLGSVFSLIFVAKYLKKVFIEPKKCVRKSKIDFRFKDKKRVQSMIIRKNVVIY